MMGYIQPNPGTPWPAVDGLGRAVPTQAEVGPPRESRFVGIFYFLWSGYHDTPGEGPYDVSKIMQANPDALRNPNSPPWGPHGHMHFWGEPLYGYYRNADPWVLRRHAHLLADAGVDTLIFDTTNRVTYREVYLSLCKVFTQVRAEGGRTPHIAFMVNTEAGETAQDLYRDLYQPGLYRDLWFIWQGKPLMICDPQAASNEVRDFFTLRRAHWPFEQINTPYAWHWEATYPQHYGFTDDPAVPEQINVSVAQNLRASDGQVTNMSNGDARGRSFHDGVEDRMPGAVKWGHNFSEQWDRALVLDPPFVMITGWNEWIAGRWPQGDNPNAFVDQFDEEFSRDIEPMAHTAHGGGHDDNYYYQMVSGIRRYKGAPVIPRASAPKTIRIEDGFEQWDDIGPDFSDHLNETQPRDFDGVGPLHYVNRSGRNDLVTMKVARDERNIYFYAQTREPISPWRDPNWMLLLIDANQDPQTGWEGFDYIVNHTVPGVDTTLLERNTGGWNWEKVGEVKFRVAGNQMHLAVPRAALGLTAEPLTFDFKWFDNPQRPGDVMDFYLSGDTAPEGRFKFRFLAD